jgi:hypothetical protein
MKDQGNTEKLAGFCGEDYIFSITYVDYSSGSTTFGEIAVPSGAPYTRVILVLDSLAGVWVGRP